MINSIPLQTLRNGEFLQFISDILGIVSLNNPVQLQVSGQFTQLQAEYVSLQELFKTDRSNPVTEEIIALDIRRDEAVTGISALINAFTHHFNPAIRNPANLLQANLKLYGAGVARDNYMSETATISSIVGDWKNKPELQAAMVSLQVGDWLTELEQANTAFNTRYISRTQEIGAASPDNIKQKRVNVANAYYALRNHVDAYFTINQGAEPFAKACNEINALVDQYNALLAGRLVKPADSVAKEPNTNA
ncbi:MAG: hypothetical protein HYU71_01440 [Bacteroidetes bacterium]|nr:hypothetical protein [Bacteroidota bacterium]